ncbi:FCD domain-containing protein [Candidatus Sodalis pierantonius]|uniref:FCD domain-containing protein n=1 Tax=Candidatus Sodalis pierantonii TaxID=1486991 RepID=UPI001F2BB3DF|nr:FCD domain-containing protein [Candidatus Sodalis pierantonius]
MPAATLDAIEEGINALLAAADPSPQQDWQIDSQLHQSLAHYSGNALLMQYIESLRLKTRMFNMRQVPERFIKGHHEHLAIIAALRHAFRGVVATVGVAHE